MYFICSFIPLHNTGMCVIMIMCATLFIHIDLDNDNTGMHNTGMCVIMIMCATLFIHIDLDNNTCFSLLFLSVGLLLFFCCCFFVNHTSVLSIIIIFFSSISHILGFFSCYVLMPATLSLDTVPTSAALTSVALTPVAQSLYFRVTTNHFIIASSSHPDGPIPCLQHSLLTQHKLDFYCPHLRKLFQRNSWTRSAQGSLLK